MSQVLSERLPNFPVGVLSGPNLAHEIAQRHLTASVVASGLQRFDSWPVMRLLQNIFVSTAPKI